MVAAAAISGASSALPDSLPGWLALLEARHGQRIALGLERVAAVRDRMAVGCDAVIITVGGTNGKGSCCAMLEGILLAAGDRVRVVQGGASVELVAQADEGLAAGCVRVAAAHPSTAALGAMSGDLSVERA